MKLYHLIAAGLMLPLATGSAGQSPPPTPAAAASDSDDGGRIVNGKNAEYDTAPWQVYLEWVDQSTSQGHACGAVLIRPSWVLTARHCLSNQGADFDLPTAIRNIKLSAGHLFIGKPTSANARADEKLVQRRKIDQIHLAPGWAITAQNFKLGDVALLHVSEPFVLNQPVGTAKSPQSITLPPATDGFPSKGPGQISGWGRTRWTAGQSSGDLSLHLQFAQVDILPAAQCEDAAGMKPPIPEQLVCAWARQSDERKNSTTCQGDSGGPLVLLGAKPMLVGLVSGGIGCGRNAAAFSRVSHYVPWIRSIIGAAR